MLAKEHKPDKDMPPKLQKQLKDLGYHGVFSAAERTEADGLSAGVAVLVPTFVMKTDPLMLKSPEIVPARAVAAQVSWGCKG